MYTIVIHIYIYIYNYRERERDSASKDLNNAERRGGSRCGTRSACSGYAAASEVSPSLSASKRPRLVGRRPTLDALGHHEASQPALAAERVELRLITDRLAAGGDEHIPHAQRFEGQGKFGRGLNSTPLAIMKLARKPGKLCQIGSCFSGVLLEVVTAEACNAP